MNTHPPCSDAESLAFNEKARNKWYADHKPEEWWKIEYDWPVWQRDDQHPPPGDWTTWFVMAGRAFGKTRMAAEWIRAAAEADGNLRIALVAATFHEARSVMIEGESGLLAIAPDETRPLWEPSLKKLEWSSGAVAHVYAASEPEGKIHPGLYTRRNGQVDLSTVQGTGFGLRVAEIGRVLPVPAWEADL